MRHPGVFASREEAADALATELVKMAGTGDGAFERPVVLALPRGGVPIGLAVAQALHAPLDLLMVRKIGVPWQPELAAAAIVDGDKYDLVLNDRVMSQAGLTVTDLQPTIDAELAEIERRRHRYLEGRPSTSLRDRTVIIVDDGIATGTTLRAAIKALRRRGPRELVVAVPVAPVDTVATLRSEVDRVICLSQPADFTAIGFHYRDFHALSDEEVTQLLALAPRDTHAAAEPPSSPP
jgi:putative phosphoribosyl transferase